MPANFGILVTSGLLEALLWGSCLEIRRDGVTLTTGYPGFRRRQTLSLAEMDRIVPAKEYSHRVQDYFCLQLEIPAGRPLIVVKRLEGRQAAVAVARWVRERRPTTR